MDCQMRRHEIIATLIADLRNMDARGGSSEPAAGRLTNGPPGRAGGVPAARVPETDRTERRRRPASVSLHYS